MGNAQRNASKDWHGVLGVRKTASMKEITTTYYELAKVHHPDHGGDQATFLQIHKAYRELKKVVLNVEEFVEAELSNRAIPEDAVQMMGDNEDKYWIGKKKKIQDLLGEQKFAVKGKGDAWSGFLYRVREAPHMTDGFSEFYCLYLHGCYYSSKMMETVLEVIDFMADKTYYFLLITIDGIYKQIYIGRDISINYNNCSLSVQPLVEEIKEDMQYYLE